MEPRSFEIEVLTRLATIDEKLDNYTDRIKKVEASITWITRVVITETIRTYFHSGNYLARKGVRI